MKLPAVRTTNIVEQPLAKELLLYDLEIHKAYSLNETLALVYRHCDGQTTFAQLRRKNRGLTDEVILLAVDELSRENLLAGKFESGISRRVLLQKAAVSVVALPIIVSLFAPTAAQAASGGCSVTCLTDGSTCNIANPGACCGGTCNNVGGGLGTCSGGLPPGATCCVSNPAVCDSGTCSNTGGGFGTCA
jgi:hypothetical protein